MHNFWPYTLRAGHSSTPAQGACAMDAVNWLVYGKHGDTPECACPIIARFVIGGNDVMDDTNRQRLLPYLHRIAGSRSAPHQSSRERILVLAALRVFAPLALDFAGLNAEGQKLRALPENVDLATATKVAEKAAAKATKAANAADAVDAPAWGTWWAKGVTARAAAEAARAAAKGAAAYAAAKAATAADAAWDTKKGHATSVWDAYFATLDAALLAGPQGEPWSADIISAGEVAFAAVGGVAERHMIEPAK